MKSSNLDFGIMILTVLFVILDGAILFTIPQANLVFKIAVMVSAISLSSLLIIKHIKRKDNTP